MSRLDAVHAAQALAAMTRPADADREATRLRYASALALCTRERRQELDMTIADAAALAGLQISEWMSVEDGWVPEDLGTIRALAGALRVSWKDLQTIAFFAGLWQQRG